MVHGWQDWGANYDETKDRYLEVYNNSSFVSLVIHFILLFLWRYFFLLFRGRGAGLGSYLCIYVFISC